MKIHHKVTLVLLFYSLFYCGERNQDLPSLRITKFPKNKSAALSITFDDGCQSVFTKIVPLLAKYNLKATFFIIASSAETNNEWEKWRELILKGHEVGNHTLTHKVYLGTSQNVDELTLEIDSSLTLLANRLGKTPFSFAHPFNSTNILADQIVFKSHYASKISPSGFCKLISLFDLDLFKTEVKNAISKETWLVTSAHGIDDCYQPLTNDFVDKFLAFIAFQSDEVSVNTFENLSKYKIEREQTKLSIIKHGDDGYIVSAKTTLNKEVFDLPLTLEISLDGNSYQIESINSELPQSFFFKDGKTYIEILPNSSLVFREK
jgi:peptidoglycan/xylan/chitin deacetylase (PgdA/CDA1 family)